MPRPHNFGEQLSHIYQNKTLKTGVRNISFQVTDDCCCACTYCYQGHKGKRYMKPETAAACIDLLFQMNKEITDINAVVHNQTLGIILDFIGGEPLMNLPIIDYICDYFLNKCLELNHPWVDKWRASMISNGAKYFEADTQNFLNKFNGFVSFGITLDGPKEVHNACRIYHDGTGNFDDAYAAFKDCQARFGCNETKVTISSINLPIISQIIDFFVNEGIQQINANPVYEEKWTNEQASIYYQQLKIIADKNLIEYPNVSTSLFTEDIGHPLPEDDLQIWCGGLGMMLAFDPDGKAFPCIRYMKSSLGNDQPEVIVGDCWDGVYNTPQTIQIYKDLTSVDRKTQSTSACFRCPIASGCAYCAAWNYQETGKFNSRSTNVCPMHKARVLANVYYWNKKYQMEGTKKVFDMYLDENSALNFISKDEYYMLLDLVNEQKKNCES